MCGREALVVVKGIQEDGVDDGELTGKGYKITNHGDSFSPSPIQDTLMPFQNDRYYYCKQFEKPCNNP